MRASRGSRLPMTGTPTRLLILRHGEVHAEDRRALYGQLDVRLSERGHHQAQVTGLALRSYPIAAVYSSDLARSSILGREIARHHGLRPVLTPHLRERAFGHWQGLPWDEVEERFPDEVAAYHADRFSTRVPGGAENFYDLRQRVLAYGREMIARHPGKTIAIAAHSGPCRMLLAEGFQMPMTSIFNFEQDYCCLNVIEYYSSGRVRVRTVNSVEHLAKLDDGTLGKKWGSLHAQA